MGYKDALDHGETNVGLGMVPDGTKEDRLQRRIRQLKNRVRELEDWQRRGLPHLECHKKIYGPSAFGGYFPLDALIDEAKKGNRKE